MRTLIYQRYKPDRAQSESFQISLNCNVIPCLYMIFQMILKITFGSQIHVVSSKKGESFEKLVAFIHKVFKQLPTQFAILFAETDDVMKEVKGQDEVITLLGYKLKIAKLYLQECPIKQKLTSFQNTKQKTYSELQQSDPKDEQLLIEEITEVNSDESSQFQNLDESIESKVQSMLPYLVQKIKQSLQKQMRQEATNVQTDNPEEALSNQVIKQEKSIECHIGIECNECQNSDSPLKYITGIRYYCSVCQKYNLCSKCEQKSTHEHPFLKIKNIQQTPLKVISILETTKQSTQRDQVKSESPEVYTCWRQNMKASLQSLKYNLLIQKNLLQKEKSVIHDKTNQTDPLSFQNSTKILSSLCML